MKVSKTENWFKTSFQQPKTDLPKKPVLTSLITIPIWFRGTHELPVTEASFWRAGLTWMHHVKGVAGYCLCTRDSQECCRQVVN